MFVAEGETTRCVGDVLAAVAARTRREARAAAALVDVEYEVLDPVVDPFAALEPGAPQVHAGGNLLSTSVVRRGDASAALPRRPTSSATASRRARSSTRSSSRRRASPCPAAGAGSDPRLHLFSQGQGAWEDRRQVAALLGLPEAAVRVTQVATGGAFGGKEDLSRPGPGRAPRARDRPARPPRALPAGEPPPPPEAPRDDARLRGRLRRGRPARRGPGAHRRRHGRVRERRREGARARGRTRVRRLPRPERGRGGPRGLHERRSRRRVPRLRRAPGDVRHGRLLDRLAALVGIDGWEIRWRNALRDGDRFGTGQLLGPGVGLEKTLLAVRDAYRGARFAGIACGAKNVGIGNGMVERGRAILRPEGDGDAHALALLDRDGPGGPHGLRPDRRATIVGVDPAAMRVLVDTERELDTGETTASRATTLGGQAVADAARRLRAALDEFGPGADVRTSPAASSTASTSSTGRRRSARGSRTR